MEKKDTSAKRHQILTIVGWVLCVILVPILIINCTLLVKSFVSDEVPDFGGTVPFIVLSDSMYPRIKSGDLILCQKIDAEDVKEGDIISFYDPASNKSAVVTHKVIERYEEDGKLYFRTTGIHNNSDDRLPVSADRVIAKYDGDRIPYLGYIAIFMQSTTGLMVCVVLPILLFVGYDFIRRRKFEKTQNQDVEALMAELAALKAANSAKEAAAPEVAPAPDTENTETDQTES